MKKFIFSLLMVILAMPCLEGTKLVLLRTF